MSFFNVRSLSLGVTALFFSEFFETQQELCSSSNSWASRPGWVLAWVACNQRSQELLSSFHQRPRRIRTKCVLIFSPISKPTNTTSEIRKSPKQMMGQFKTLLADYRSTLLKNMVF